MVARRRRGRACRRGLGSPALPRRGSVARARAADRPVAPGGALDRGGAAHERRHPRDVADAAPAPGAACLAALRDRVEALGSASSTSISARRCWLSRSWRPRGEPRPPRRRRRRPPTGPTICLASGTPQRPDRRAVGGGARQRRPRRPTTTCAQQRRGPAGRPAPTTRRTTRRPAAPRRRDIRSDGRDHPRRPRARACRAGRATPARPPSPSVPTTVPITMPGDAERLVERERDRGVHHQVARPTARSSPTAAGARRTCATAAGWRPARAARTPTRTSRRRRARVASASNSPRS